MKFLKYIFLLAFAFTFSQSDGNFAHYEALRQQQISESSTFNPLDLISYYRLDGDVTSETGNFDGEVLSVVDLTYGAGINGQSAIFNGTTSRFEIPIDVIANQSSFSISFFVKLNNTATVQRCVFNNSTNAPYTLIQFNNGASNNVNFNVLASTTEATCSALATDLTTWTHLTFTVGGGEAKIYINGVLSDTSTYSGTFTQLATNYNVIGSNRSRNNYFVDGAIGGIGIWSKELTNSEVVGIYNYQNTTGDIL